MIKGYTLKILCLAIVTLLCGSKHGLAQKKEASIIFKFENQANHKLLVLNDSSYVNDFGEHYSITKLKYYISDISLGTKEESFTTKNIFLMDAANEEKISINILPGIYSKIIFILGVDSAYNNSGAQEGALDPLNGMFWTWNTGYVYFKMEGYSPASNADLNRIEHHIGGYRGPNKANRQIRLNFLQPLVINDGDQKEIVVNLNLDKYWKGPNDISIQTNALIMTTGELAKKSADNFPGMFFIKSVK